MDPNAKLLHTNQYLPSEVNLEDMISFEATTVMSVEGETVKLTDKVCCAFRFFVLIDLIHRTYNII